AVAYVVCFFFSSRRRHTRFKCDWSSDVCSSDLPLWFNSYVLPSFQTPAGGDEPGAEVPLPVRGRHPLAHHPQLLDLRLPDRTPRSEERRVGKEWKSRVRTSSEIRKQSRTRNEEW